MPPRRNGAEPAIESIMKIHQLPLGARFEYEGQEYVKTGPLFGTGPAGQGLIPKYAVLRPLDAVDASRAAAPSGTVPRAVTGNEAAFLSTLEEYAVASAAAGRRRAISRAVG